MSSAGWKTMWDLALASFAREPTAIQILIVLAAAFAAAMIVEGVHASFLPIRHAVLIARKYAANGLPAAAVLTRAPSASRQAFAPRTGKFSVPAKPGPRNLKRQIDSVKRQKPTKPRIQRVPMVNIAPEPEYTIADELPAFSPPPPLDEPIEV